MIRWLSRCLIRWGERGLAPAWDATGPVWLAVTQGSMRRRLERAGERPAAATGWEPCPTCGTLARGAHTCGVQAEPAAKVVQIKRKGRKS